jgi:hypothetical protein
VAGWFHILTRPAPESAPESLEPRVLESLKQRVPESPEPRVLESRPEPGSTKPLYSTPLVILYPVGFFILSCFLVFSSEPSSTSLARDNYLGISAHPAELDSSSLRFRNLSPARESGISDMRLASSKILVHALVGYLWTCRKLGPT